jgi:glycine/D-amino acid oxidase-like deaminating enzyme
VRVVWPEQCDVLIVGGGFYGCCLALFLRSVAQNVVILESRDELLTRASFVNQARIHTGFHYPRSFVTARRSLALYQRFMADFSDAVVDDFTMLYAIARFGSKVTPQRFVKMFEDMKAPITNATVRDRALFDSSLVADVSRCQEFAFNATVLRDILRTRLDDAGIRVITGATVEAIEPTPPPGVVTVQVSGHPPIVAPIVIDATYGQFTGRKAGQRSRSIALKYELTEIALIEPPDELRGFGVTLMDGPFFSVMPFPARGCYSLTHTRYTPHRAWTSGQSSVGGLTDPPSHWMHMQRDAMRYLPCLKDLNWLGSLFEIKTLLLRNESDDGRPILLDRDPVNSGLMTVLGGKLDNIYDLFDALVATGGIYATAHTGYLTDVSVDGAP